MRQPWEKQWERANRQIQTPDEMRWPEFGSYSSDDASASVFLASGRSLVSRRRTVASFGCPADVALAEPHRYPRDTVVRLVEKLKNRNQSVSARYTLLCATLSEYNWRPSDINSEINSFFHRDTCRVHLPPLEKLREFYPYIIRNLFLNIYTFWGSASARCELRILNILWDILGALRAICAL